MGPRARKTGVICVWFVLGFIWPLHFQIFHYSIFSFVKKGHNHINVHINQEESSISLVETAQRQTDNRLRPMRAGGKGEFKV